MAVCLTGLTGIKVFDAVGEPATLAQRWKTWKSEFELYVVASGVSDKTQKRALLLHLAGPQVRDIFNNSILANVKGEAKRLNESHGHSHQLFQAPPPPPPPPQTKRGQWRGRPSLLLNQLLEKRSLTL